MTAECPLLGKRTAATIDLASVGLPNHQLTVKREDQKGGRQYEPNLSRECAIAEFADKARALGRSFRGLNCSFGYCERCAMHVDLNQTLKTDTTR